METYLIKGEISILALMVGIAILIDWPWLLIGYGTMGIVNAIFDAKK